HGEAKSAEFEGRERSGDPGTPCPQSYHRFGTSWSLAKPARNGVLARDSTYAGRHAIRQPRLGDGELSPYGQVVGHLLRLVEREAMDRLDVVHTTSPCELGGAGAVEQDVVVQIRFDDVRRFVLDHRIDVRNLPEACQVR